MTDRIRDAAYAKAREIGPDHAKLDELAMRYADRIIKHVRESSGFYPGDLGEERGNCRIELWDCLEGSG